MGIFQQFPYSNFHEMNLDQIIKIMREMQDEWENTKSEWESYKDFIDNYFENLDVSEEVLEALRIMVPAGELDPVIDPVIASATAEWLSEHITPTTPPIDDTLTVEGAAADAKATGDIVFPLVDKVNNLFNYVSGNVFKWWSFYLNASTGARSASTKSISTNWIPAKSLKYMFIRPNSDPTYVYKVYIYKYAVDGYTGVLTGGNIDDGYTWGTSGAMTFEDYFDFTRMAEDYPNDYLLIRLDKIHEGSRADIDVTEKEHVSFIFSSDFLIENSDINMIKLDFENGRLDSGTGIPISSTPERRLRTHQYYKIKDLKQLYCDVGYTMLVFLYNSNFEYIGTLSSPITNDYAPLSTGVWSVEWNFDYVNQIYPGYYCKIMVQPDGAGNITPADFTPHYIAYGNETEILQYDKNDDHTIYTVLDEQFVSMAYSKVNNIGDAPINSIEHYKYIASLDVFNCIKGDARVTSDNRIIMCHDPGFTLDGNGRITTYDSLDYTPIHTLTYAQCMALEYADQWNGSYATVSDYETFLSICKASGKLAYLVIRDEYIDDIAEEIVNVAARISMTHRLIVNSFTFASLQIVSRVEPNLMYSLVIDNAALTASDVQHMLIFKNPMLTLFDFGGARTGFTALAAYDAADLIDYAVAHGVRLFEAICGLQTLDMTLEDFSLECLKYGVVGAQISSLVTGEI